MAVPEGFIKPTQNTSYYNVDYYIDSSVRPSSDLKYYMFGSEDNPTLYKDIDENPIYITTADGNYIHIGSCGSDWTYSFVNGKVEGVDTINVYMELDEDWLYIKEPTPQPATHEMTITLGEGVESLEMNFTEPDIETVDIDLTVENLNFIDFGLDLQITDSRGLVYSAVEQGEQGYYTTVVKVVKGSEVTIAIVDNTAYDVYATINGDYDGSFSSITLTANDTITAIIGGNLD